MEDSDELFDYIADLPSDNVLEICNFVLVGGGGGGEVGGEGGHGLVNDGRVVSDHDRVDLESTVHHYNNNFVEILDFQVEPSNNNNNNNINERILENSLNEGPEKVKVISLDI